MKLLRLNNYQIEIEPEILVFQPFKKIWKRDRDRNKQNAINEITFIYFYADLRSEFAYIIDDDTREKEIIDSIGLSDFKMDETIRQAIELYKRLTETASSKLLKSTLRAVDKLSKFLDEIDFYETDNNGKMKYPINTVTTAIKQIPDLVTNLQDAQKKVAKEIEEEGRARGGNNSKTLFEDGLDL